MPAYFEALGDNRYRPTEHAGGAWNPGELHFSPLGGLIVHAIDRHRARSADTKQLGRISFDILGFLASDVCEISVRTLRPGRMIELAEVTVVIGGRSAVLARAWLIAAADTTVVEGDESAPLPSPDELAVWPFGGTWPGGYVASLEARAVGTPRPGRTTAWLRTGIDLVDTEPASPHAIFITLVDTANGVAARQPITEWMFPNIDLTIHLFREPTGPWLGLDTSVAFGPTGLGLTSSTLHDTRGPVGRAEQVLTVRPLP